MAEEFVPSSLATSVADAGGPGATALAPVPAPLSPAAYWYYHAKATAARGALAGAVPCKAHTIFFLLPLQSACPSPTSPAVPLAPSGIRNLAVTPALRRLPSAQILLRRPPLTPQRQDPRAQAPTSGTHGVRLLWRLAGSYLASCARPRGAESVNPSTRY